jgi:soluble lytic murein transglycosylase-like protein
MHGSAAPTGPSQPSAATLTPFSESERERIGAVQGIVAHAAAERGIDQDLINAVIWVESRFDPAAKSPAGARGLMQLMPATAAYLAKQMGEHNPRAYDPEFNVRAGSLYLA